MYKKGEKIQNLDLNFVLLPFISAFMIHSFWFGDKKPSSRHYDKKLGNKNGTSRQRPTSYFLKIVDFQSPVLMNFCPYVKILPLHVMS